MMFCILSSDILLNIIQSFHNSFHILLIKVNMENNKFSKSMIQAWLNCSGMDMLVFISFRLVSSEALNQYRAGGPR